MTSNLNPFLNDLTSSLSHPSCKQKEHIYNILSARLVSNSDAFSLIKFSQIKALLFKLAIFIIMSIIHPTINSKAYFSFVLIKIMSPSLN